MHRDAALNETGTPIGIIYLIIATVPMFAEPA